MLRRVCLAVFCAVATLLSFSAPAGASTCIEVNQFKHC